ncbi:MAG: DUF72 domain-containing protein [Dehalococcoidales bacterium]
MLIGWEDERHHPHRHRPPCCLWRAVLRKALAQWANEIRRWSDQGYDIYGFFDNDEAGYATGDVLKLISLTRNP